MTWTPIAAAVALALGLSVIYLIVTAITDRRDLEQRVGEWERMLDRLNRAEPTPSQVAQEWRRYLDTLPTRRT